MLAASLGWNSRDATSERKESFCGRASYLNWSAKEVISEVGLLKKKIIIIEKLLNIVIWGLLPYIQLCILWLIFGRWSTV